MDFTYRAEINIASKYDPKVDLDIQVEMIMSRRSVIDGIRIENTAKTLPDTAKDLLIRVITESMIDDACVAYDKQLASMN